MIHEHVPEGWQQMSHVAKHAITASQTKDLRDNHRHQVNQTDLTESSSMRHWLLHLANFVCNLLAVSDLVIKPSEVPLRRVVPRL